MNASIWNASYFVRGTLLFKLKPYKNTDIVVATSSDYNNLGTD